MTDALREGIFDTTKHLNQCDFREPILSWEQRCQIGKSLREKLPRE
jgi:hypothetical protein